MLYNNEQVIGATEKLFAHQPIEFYLRGIQALWSSWNKCIKTFENMFSKTLRIFSDF